MKSAPALAPILATPPRSSAELAGGTDLPFGLQSVCRTLAGTDAQLQRFAWLGDHLAIAEWVHEVDVAETVYERPGHHTLSCYFTGGERTERHKVPGYGGPSRLCTLPGDHESRWLVRGNMRFMHLYFLPEHFTQRAVSELDREPRELILADRTYFEDPRVVLLCRDLLLESWDDVDGRLRANQTVHAVLSRLLRGQSQVRTGLARIGGLSPTVRRRVRDYIDAMLDQPITLGELAALATLSEYHFARMFHVSFGLPPHAWVAEQRLARARALLRIDALPLTLVAARCGYANVNHFNQRFRKAHGVAPTVFRKAMLGA
ncbi:helix-turn-helix transcriptional regulator [Burkholderia sp. Ap-962]|uniref:AraC family transcriptional regulator n=1 Tax=Burkholderia sp. Ap-962 TaxID=2608333 RepID=UPI001422EE88|nr:AraC family transcriptional regulator [Burkholderia sp. Ap-962]NIF69337.1 helix-turn-helix transcriptional regulator [Burkholderia sp. Ap-962]